MRSSSRIRANDPFPQLVNLERGGRMDIDAARDEIAGCFGQIERCQQPANALRGDIVEARRAQQLRCAPASTLRSRSVQRGLNSRPVMWAMDQEPEASHHGGLPWTFVQSALISARAVSRTPEWAPGNSPRGSG
ncbi:MAG: hypothetical protein M3N47_05105, partial [Chloroflexota bacterium]|nr:hypothetical protein [Chloroflexota bacterium]